MNSQTLDISTTINDSSRSVFATRFKELILALNTNSPVLRFSVIRELLNSYHFNLLNDNEIRYIIEQFQSKSVKATETGKLCAQKGSAPVYEPKTYRSAIFLPVSKCCFTCLKCQRNVAVGEPVVLHNTDRWCGVCGVEANPSVRMQRPFFDWNRAKSSP